MTIEADKVRLADDIDREPGAGAAAKDIGVGDKAQPPPPKISAPATKPE